MTDLELNSTANPLKLYDFRYAIYPLYNSAFNQQNSIAYLTCQIIFKATEKH